MIFSRLFGLMQAGPSRAVSFDDLRRDLDSGACVLIDVREPNEFRAGHVPGSRNMPLSRFDARQLPQDRKTALICQSGMPSGRALAIARSAGRTDVVHFAGGVSQWRAHGGTWRR